MGKRIFDACVFTVITIGGSFIPLLAAVLYPKIFGEKSTSMMDLTGKGEITIMCIPMCISIAIVLYNYKKEIGISKLAHFVYIVTFFWLIIAAGLYAYGVNKLDTPKPGLITFSVWFLGWTVISMIVSKYVEDDTIESLRDPRNAELDNLEHRVTQNRN